MHHAEKGGLDQVIVLAGKPARTETGDDAHETASERDVIEGLSDNGGVILEEDG